MATLKRRTVGIFPAGQENRVLDALVKAMRARTAGGPRYGRP